MKIIVYNLTTEYKDEGQGPVILMLHGWGRDISDFDGLIEKVKEKYRIVRLDLPGFGGTEMPREIFKLDDYINFVKSFIQKLNIKPNILLGHSFGGRIIIKGIGQNKLYAEKLILISPAGVKTDRLRKTVFMILAKIGNIVSYIPPLIFIRRILKNKFYKIVDSDYLESGRMKKIFKAVVEEDLMPYASKIDIETLLIWGEEDTQTPLKDGRLIHSLIQNSKLEIIKNTGHFSFIEKPEEVTRLII